MAQPLLAPTRGSRKQFVLASVPFLIVLLYFLFLAYRRPNLQVYNMDDIDDDRTMNQIVNETGELIPLMHILTIFLTFLVLWSHLAVYMLVFIPMRRQLVQSYLQEGKEVLGDVYVNDTNRRCRWCFADYAYAFYKHPEKTGYMIRKRIRTFQHFTRENVSILLLPPHNFSGQPKMDLELDLMSAARDKSRSLFWFLAFWVLFTLLCPIYIIYQMSQVDDDYEDASIGWRNFFIVVCIVVPVVAGLGNWAKFAWYKYWLLHRGSVVGSGDADSMTREKAITQSMAEDDGIGTCMSDFNCGDEGPPSLDQDDNINKTDYVSMKDEEDPKHTMA